MPFADDTAIPIPPPDVKNKTEQLSMNNDFLKMLMKLAGLLLTASLANVASAVVPSNTQLPTVSGTLTVGSTITVNPGVWNGERPITFAYKYQVCSATGTNCVVAPGLFPNGPRPTLLLIQVQRRHSLSLSMDCRKTDRTAAKPFSNFSQRVQVFH